MTLDQCEQIYNVLPVRVGRAYPLGKIMRQTGLDSEVVESCLEELRNQGEVYCYGFKDGSGAKFWFRYA